MAGDGRRCQDHPLGIERRQRVLERLVGRGPIT